MVRAAERHGELITHAATKGGWLREAEVMGIRRSPFAKETRLRGHELKMRAIAVAARLVQRQHALVHAQLLTWLVGGGGGSFMTRGAIFPTGLCRAG